MKILVRLIFFISITWPNLSLADKEVEKKPEKTPAWFNQCIDHLEECVIYILNPDKENTNFFIFPNKPSYIFWGGVSARAYVKHLSLEKPIKSGFIDVLLPVPQLSSFSGYEPTFPENSYGQIKIDSNAIVPEKAFRKITACWPFLSMTLVDQGDDGREYNIVMSKRGKAYLYNKHQWDCDKKMANPFDKSNFDACVYAEKEWSGQFYVYGDALYQLRIKDPKIKGKLTDKYLDIRNRFFIITGDEKNRAFEAVSGLNYTDNIQLRTFSENTCQHILSAEPEWKAWDKKSQEKIIYPPFPLELKEEWRNFWN